MDRNDKYEDLVNELIDKAREGREKSSTLFFYLNCLELDRDTEANIVRMVMSEVPDYLYIKWKYGEITDFQFYNALKQIEDKGDIEN